MQLTLETGLQVFVHLVCLCALYGPISLTFQTHVWFSFSWIWWLFGLFWDSLSTCLDFFCLESLLNFVPKYIWFVYSFTCILHTNRLSIVMFTAWKNVPNGTIIKLKITASAKYDQTSAKFQFCLMYQKVFCLLIKVHHYKYK